MRVCVCVFGLNKQACLRLMIQLYEEHIVQDPRVECAAHTHRLQSFISLSWVQHLLQRRTLISHAACVLETVGNEDRWAHSVQFGCTCLTRVSPCDRCTSVVEVRLLICRPCWNVMPILWLIVARCIHRALELYSRATPCMAFFLNEPMTSVVCLSMQCMGSGRRM